MYSIIQFSEEHGGSVSIVNNKWFTPRRCEVYWPPVKGTKAFEKLLADANTPDTKWRIYTVQRVFGETDNIEKAKKKLKLVEVTSDIQSEAEAEAEAEAEPSGKRKRTKRSFSSSDEDPLNDNNIRPPLKKKTLQKIQIASNSCLDSYYEDTHGSQSNICLETPSVPESYQKKVISLLSCIKVQNEQIISLLTNTSTLKGTLKPELKFPLHDSDELNAIEELLQEKENKDNLVSYMKTLGGRDVSSRVSRILKFCLTDQVAGQFNFYGKRSNKKAFCQLRLRDCIVASTNLVGKFTQSVRRIVQDVKDEGASSGQTKEEVIETNERLRAVRVRLDENYDTAKKALIVLMARYSESKAERNVFTRYALLKAMIKDVIRLETQYWSLVEIPRQEKAETVPAFVLRACAIMEKTQKSGEGVKTSTKLAEEAADRRERIERLNDMTTSLIETENTQMTNDLYRLLKKYTGLRNLIRELKSDYVRSKVYPMFPRYTMLKDMIKDIMHDPDYMEVCHEVDP